MTLLTHERSCDRVGAVDDGRVEVLADRELLDFWLERATFR